MPVLGEAIVRDQWDNEPKLPESLRKKAEDIMNVKNDPNTFVKLYELVNEAYKRGYQDAKGKKE